MVVDTIRLKPLLERRNEAKKRLLSRVVITEDGHWLWQTKDSHSGGRPRGTGGPTKKLNKPRKRAVFNFAGNLYSAKYAAKVLFNGDEAPQGAAICDCNIYNCVAPGHHHWERESHSKAREVREKEVRQRKPKDEFDPLSFLKAVKESHREALNL